MIWFIQVARLLALSLQQLYDFYCFCSRVLKVLLVGGGGGGDNDEGAGGGSGCVSSIFQP